MARKRICPQKGRGEDPLLEDKMLFSYKWGLPGLDGQLPPFFLCALSLRHLLSPPKLEWGQEQPGDMLPV